MTPMPLRRHLLVYLAALLLAARASGNEHVRVATYNIAWLSSENAQCGTEQVRDVRTQGARLSRLQEVVTLLDADIIGLQEIRDRGALEMVFAPADWTIVIDDESASRRHCLIERRGRDFFLVDGGSTNGTYLNDRRVREVRLSDGDRTATR